MGYGIKSVKDIKVMERAQPLSDHRLAIDAVIAISIRSISVKLKYFLSDKFSFCGEGQQYCIITKNLLLESEWDSYSSQFGIFEQNFMLACQSLFV